MAVLRGGLLFQKTPPTVRQAVAPSRPSGRRTYVSARIRIVRPSLVSIGRQVTNAATAGLHTIGRPIVSPHASSAGSPHAWHSIGRPPAWPWDPTTVMEDSFGGDVPRRNKFSSAAMQSYSSELRLAPVCDTDSEGPKNRELGNLSNQLNFVCKKTD